MDGCEALSYVYAVIIDGMDPDDRREFDYKLRPDETVAEDFDYLPGDLGRPPAWWANPR